MIKRIALVLSLAVLGALVLAGPVLAQKGGTRNLSANLTGGAEVPGPGDPNGSGFASVAWIPRRA